MDSFIENNVEDGDFKSVMTIAIVALRLSGAMIFFKEGSAFSLSLLAMDSEARRNIRSVSDILMCPSFVCAHIQIEPYLGMSHDVFKIHISMHEFNSFGND